MAIAKTRGTQARNRKLLVSVKSGTHTYTHTHTHTHIYTHHNQFREVAKIKSFGISIFKQIKL